MIFEVQLALPCEDQEFETALYFKILAEGEPKEPPTNKSFPFIAKAKTDPEVGPPDTYALQVEEAVCHRYFSKQLNI